MRCSATRHSSDQQTLHNTYEVGGLGLVAVYISVVPPSTDTVRQNLLICWERVIKRLSAIIRQAIWIWDLSLLIKSCKFLLCKLAKSHSFAIRPSKSPSILELCLEWENCDKNPPSVQCFLCWHQKHIDIKAHQFLALSNTSIYF